MSEGDLPAHLVCASDQFGELEKAGAFVYRDFEPLDEPTTEYVENLLSELGIHPRGTVVMRKYVRCLSDFLMAVRTTTTEKISWSGAATEYQGKPYGYDVATTVRDALIAGGHMVMVQKASKCQRRSKTRPLWRSKSRPSGRERLGACGSHLASTFQGALAVRPIL